MKAAVYYSTLIFERLKKVKKLTMKKLTTICFTLITFLFVQAAQAQTLEEILKMHFEAVGQSKLNDVKTVHSTGNIVQAGFEIPFNSYMSRPGMFRVEGTFQGLTFIQTYNGNEGWDVNPFAGSTEPQPMGPDQLKEMKNNADIDGMLWNWKEKGSTVTLEANEEVEGTDCYKIKLVSAEGDTYNMYIDTESLMLIRTNSKTTIQGVETEGDTYMSNFLQVDGMVFPGKMDIKYGGVTAITFVFDKVNLNEELKEGFFDKPASN